MYLVSCVATEEAYVGVTSDAAWHWKEWLAEQDGGN